MTNGHRVDQSFEGSELPSTESHQALERLIQLADCIQEGNLDAAGYEEAMAALTRLYADITEAPPNFRQTVAAAASALDRTNLDTIYRAVQQARPTRVSTWGQDPPRPRQWLVQHWLPAGRVAMLTGEGGAGKSRLVLQLAAGIASGGQQGRWIQGPPGVLRLGEGIPADGAAVVFASWEDEPEEFDRRLCQISGSAAPWVTPKRLNKLLRANMMGEGPVWAPPQGSHISSMAELTDTGARLRRLCERSGARLLIMDPLAAAYASQENTRGLVRAFVSHWDDWSQATNCTTLLLAHPPKSSLSNYAGSTDWLGAVRALWSLQQADKQKSESAGQGRWKLESVKGNYRGGSESIELGWDIAMDQVRWKVTSGDSAIDSSGEYDYDS